LEPQISSLNNKLVTIWRQLIAINELSSNFFANPTRAWRCNGLRQVEGKFGYLRQGDFIEDNCEKFVYNGVHEDWV